MNPTMTRSNMRYRGPVESGKINNLRLGVLADLSRISAVLNTHSDTLNTLAEQFSEGQTSEVVVGSQDKTVTVQTPNGVVLMGCRLRDIETRLNAGGATLV